MIQIHTCTYRYTLALAAGVSKKAALRALKRCRKANDSSGRAVHESSNVFARLWGSVREHANVDKAGDVAIDVTADKITDVVIEFVSHLFGG